MRERLIELLKEADKKWFYREDQADYLLDNGVVVLQEDVLAELYNLIHDVNTAEISEQISADLLSSWTVQWRIAMKAKLAELKGTEE